MHTESTGPLQDPHTAQPKRRSRPRTSPIVWGVIFLAVCAWITQQVFYPESVPPEVWVAGIVLGVGVVLLAVGIAVAIRNSRQ